MAKEYIKKGGDLIPIADTQGLLIPASARGCIGKFTGPLTIASGSANITYSYDSGENWIVDGGIKVPNTGMYIVSEALNTEGSGTERVTTYRILKNNSQVGQSYQLTTNQAGDWSSYCNSTQIYCNEGDILKFNVNMYTGTNLVVNSSWLCVTLVEQSVPDIIANKGALVSGGAFQFDIDGHGYTENYSTQEVRVGTWIDGRPIFKRTLVNTTSWTSPVADSNVTKVLGTLRTGISIIDYRVILTGSPYSYFPLQMSQALYGLYMPPATPIPNYSLGVTHNSTTGEVSMTIYKRQSNPATTHPKQIGTFTYIEGEI
jgi:hypothetical protein